MVVNNLTDQLIEEGQCLVSELKKSGIKIKAALWFYFPDESAWKLMLSFPNIDRDGPKTAYQKIQKALLKSKNIDILSLDDVALEKPNSPLIQLLRSAISIEQSTNGIRFSNNVINGKLIPDAYIYCIQ